MAVRFCKAITYTETLVTCKTRIACHMCIHVLIQFVQACRQAGIHPSIHAHIHDHTCVMSRVCLISVSGMTLLWKANGTNDNSELVSARVVRCPFDKIAPFTMSCNLFINQLRDHAFKLEIGCTICSQMYFCIRLVCSTYFRAETIRAKTCKQMQMLERKNTARMLEKNLYCKTLEENI